MSDIPSGMLLKSVVLCTLQQWVFSIATAVETLHGSPLARAPTLHMRGRDQALTENISWKTLSGNEINSMCSFRFVLACICLYYMRIGLYSVRICLYLYVFVSIALCITHLCTLQTFKDGMHAYDHGVAMTILTAIIKSLHLFEALIGLAKNTLIHKLSSLLPDFKTCAARSQSNTQR